MTLMFVFVSVRLQVSRPHNAFSPVPFTPPFTGKSKVFLPDFVSQVVSGT